MLDGVDRAEGKSKAAGDLVDVCGGFFGYETKLKAACHEAVGEVDTGDLDRPGDLRAGAIGRSTGSKILGIGILAQAAPSTVPRKNGEP